MKILKYGQLTLMLLGLSNPIACADSVPDALVPQWQVALDIVSSMMDECPDVRSDPTAHELLGDIYTEARQFERAQMEYEIAISASCSNLRRPR